MERNSTSLFSREKHYTKIAKIKRQSFDGDI
jgi:hypothetical protein